MKTTSDLIFDLDGTLIDSSEGVVEAVNYSLRQVGASEQPPERIKPFIGFPLSVMYPEFTDVALDELYRHFQVRAAEVMVLGTTALPKAESTLRSLRDDGYRLGVATTKIRRHVAGILDALGWTDLFSATVGGDEVSDVKPAPEAFQLALQRMQAEAANSLVIGDTINDIHAAHAVPMRAVAVASPYGGRSQVQAASPDFFIQQIGELPDLLAEID